MESIYKTKGIVLYALRHSERGMVIHIYTEKFGRTAYYSTTTSNGRLRIGKNRVSLEPLSLIDIVGKPSPYGTMHRISEATNSYIPHSSTGDIAKASISMFLSEVLYRVIRESEPNPLLFDYISHSIRALDTIDSGIANFHLYFMVNLCGFLGYAPRGNYSENAFFDLPRGEYVIIKPQHEKYLDQISSQKLYEISKTDISSLGEVKMNRATRVGLLSAIIEFINLHGGTSYRISSLEMLSELF